MSRYLKGLVTVAAVVAMTASAHADRRNGLAGNHLIQDKDDIFVYPQRLLDYRNLINFDYGSSATAGSGVLLIGEPDFGFGLVMNRTDVNSVLGRGGVELAMASHGRDYELGQLGAPGQPFGGLPAPGAFVTPNTFIDALMAFRTGSGSTVGFRLGVGNGQNFNKPGGGGGETSDSQFTLKATGGFSSEDMDLSADLFFSSAGTIQGGQDVESGTVFGIGAHMRGFIPQGDKIKLGYLGELAFAQGSVTQLQPNPNPTRSLIDFGLVGGIGPVYTLESMKAQVAAYAIVGIGYASWEPNSESGNVEDIESDITIVIPGARMSMEAYLAEWLSFRSGMEYLFAYTSTSFENGTAISGRAGNANPVNPATFGWNAGMGIHIDQLTIDGSFSHGWLTAGPAILGAGGTMFTMLSATYTF